jgi:hypothetical protein
MPSARTSVEILNGSLQKVAEIRNLYPLNSRGMVLRYSKELSDFGDCHFRVAATTRSWPATATSSSPTSTTSG